MRINNPRIVGFVALAGAVLAGLVLMRPSTPSSTQGNVEQRAQNETPLYRAEITVPRPTAPAQPTSPESAAATRSVSNPAPARLWAAPGETTGERLDPKSASYAEAQRDGVKPKGRSSPFAPGSLTALAALRRGDNVVLPLLGGEQVAGKVNLVQQEAGGWVRIGGELTGARTGSFSVGSNGENVGGTILIPEEQIAYSISGQLMEEKALSELICFPMPRPENEQVTAQGFAPQESPPLFSSRPEATAVLYLDFDGETVTDPSWYSGNTIVAQPCSLTTAEITEVWNRVKEDYWPFNIDVTTDLNRYNNAPVGSRMRCIITPTCEWFENCAWGGVAYLNSFDRAGKDGFSSTIPCWVFNQSVVGAAEAISHELGHTLGLHHDGGIVANDRTVGPPGHENEYYVGHGSGAVSWAPIMGSGYAKSLVQWSKGEYANANNQEDDLAIIANAANGFDYVADEAGDLLGTAAPLNLSGDLLNHTGTISGNNDVDFYVFTVGAGVVSISANPASIAPNLDILLQLLNSTGTVVASSNPDSEPYASVSYYTAEAGIYYIKVQGTSRGAVLADGYSSYGSIGHYSLSGGVNLVPPTVTTQPLSQTVSGGSSVTFSVSASGSQPLNYQWRRNGVSIFGATSASYMIFNVQASQAGDYTVVVSNAGGTATSATAVLTVNAPPVIIAQPQSQMVTAGNSVAFSVTALGTAPLSYQWSFNGQLISTATGDSYSIARVQSSQAGIYTVVVNNSFGSATSAPATLAIVSGTAFGIIGAPFNYQIVANNNPTWYSASGLPSGLSCNGPTGLISGIPTRTGTFSVRVEARNFFGTASATISLTIANGAITSASSAEGVIGAPFSYQIVADNSPTWYSASGLPSGLSCNGPTGLISGMPTRTGTFSVRVEARNSFGTASTTISLTIANGAITSASSAEGTIGAVFSYQIVADNSPTWYSASGLPSGVVCNGPTGLISGIPTETGTFSIRVEARNSFGTASATIFLTIADGAITSASSAEGVIGAPFSYQIVADNSPTWYSASGLPSGVVCNGPTGLISGIPTQTGTFSVRVEARNSFGTAPATIFLTIADGAITSASSAEGVIGAPFSYQIVADNSPTWYSASSLPSGVVCNGPTGLISGIPTQTGTFSVRVEARNFFGTALATISLTISDGTIGLGLRPTLTLLQTGESLRLTWPVTADRLVLEETQVSPNAWTNSPAQVVVQGNENVVVIPATGTAKFYRLRK